MQDSHVLQDSSSVIGNDYFSSTRLDLSLDFTFQFSCKMTKRTILSIPFGPKLVRTASETANHQHLFPFITHKRTHPWQRSY
jgi:hypothetical protein